MRLRLMIHRHGIPPVQILWTVAQTRPPHASASSSITVSQFLEQVNDIIPLESEDWGLEDYAVEVGGYECLHFSELGQLLKNDEEVCIRALQTNDLRIRRISGRHQITSDGRHLIDGVAFGRPYLRRTGRPAIKLPPRKRRRVTYDDEDDTDDGNNFEDRQIVVRGDLEDEVAGDESDDEEEFVLNDDEAEDLNAELEDLQNDIHAGAGDDSGGSYGDEELNTPRTTARGSRRSPKGLGLLRLLDENGHPFAGEYSNPLLDQYGQDEPSSKVGKSGTSRLAKGGRKSARNGVSHTSANPEHVSRPELTASNKSVRFEDDELATPATIQESVDSEEVDDLEPDATGESDKENAEPPAEASDSGDESSESSTSSSLSYSEEADSDETSSSGSSSSGSSTGSDSDSEPERISTKVLGDEHDTSNTSPSGSSDSSRDSRPETRQERGNLGDTAQKSTFSTMKEKTSRADPPEPAKQVAPGEGKNRTKKRNDRRRKWKKVAYSKRGGSLMDEAAVMDLHKSKQDIKPKDAHVEDIEMENDRADEAVADIAIEAKRQALLMCLRGDSETKDVGAKGPGLRLDSEDTFAEHEREAKRQKLSTLTDAGVMKANRGVDSQVELPEVTQTGGKPVVAEGATANVPSPRDEAMIDALRSRKATVTEDEPRVCIRTIPTISTTEAEPIADALPPAIDSANIDQEDALGGHPAETETAALSSASRDTPTASSHHRRSKLDLGGAKRMLFGSLGLKTPKTKEDESNTREKLMKDVRPIKVIQADEAVGAAEDLAAIAADDSWKSKIILRAVECCHESVELSTPPFPFVQRWDPQQQNHRNDGNAKKRKNKKRKRNNDSYYEETSYQESYNQSPRHIEYEAGEPDHPNAKGSLEDQRPEHSPERNLEDSQAVDEQLLREIGDVSVGKPLGNDQLSTDLPSLPEDPTTCLPLTREIARKGTVIAFKQLEMSAETNWQPNISDYRTAIVDEIAENGDLCMTPAKRDRRSNQAEYDDRTGERLYSKFEMPGFDDQDANENIEISFDELISPILLRAVDNQANEGNEKLGKVEHHISAMNDTSGVASAQTGRETGDQQTPSIDDFADKGMEVESVSPSLEARAEISELIKEAGWRSSVQSGVNGGFSTRENSMLPEKGDNREDTTLIDPPSPKFSGFRSSPVIEVKSSPPLSDNLPEKRLHGSGTEIAESVPPHDPVDPDAKSTLSESRSVVGYPSLPDLGDDSEHFHEEAQYQSDPLIERQILSQDLISIDVDQSPVQSTRHRTRPSQDSSPPEPLRSLDATGSEDEFPEPFLQAWDNRMSQIRDIKPEPSQEDAISPPSRRKSKGSGQHSLSQRESDRTWKPEDDWSAIEDDDDNDDDDDDDGASTPRPSKSQMSSQIVDLTISSDTVDPSDSPYNGDDDSYKLPKGPGWVSKTRASRERSVFTKTMYEESKRRSR